jgi:Dual specificity phosphatase, catalytic domain
MNTIITGVCLIVPLVVIIYFLWYDFTPRIELTNTKFRNPNSKSICNHVNPVREILREPVREVVQEPIQEVVATRTVSKPISPLISRVEKREKPYLNPKIGCQVYPGLYLGNAQFASDPDLLTGLGITHIVNCAKEVPDYFKGDFNFQYLHLMLNDVPDENISRIFNVSAQFIGEALDNGGVVLVHCWAGVSRSVTVVIYYLVTTLGISGNQALEGIRKQRPIANPNRGFMEQLKAHTAV